MPSGRAAIAAASTSRERRTLAARARQAALMLLPGIVLFAVAPARAAPTLPYVVLGTDALLLLASLGFFARSRRTTRLGLHVVLGVTWCAVAVASAAGGDTITPLLVSATAAIGAATFLPWTAADQAITVAVMALAYLATLAHVPSSQVDPPWALAVLTVTLATSIFIADVQNRQRRSDVALRRSERRRARALDHERRHAEDTLSRLLDALPAPFSFVDQQQRYAMVSQPYEEWIGKPRTEMIGHSVREVLGDAAYAVVRPNLERALAGHRVDFETLIELRPGMPRHVDVRYIPRLDERGAVVGCFVMVTDITARRLAEQRARQAERLAALGTLAAGIAHEINNPVAGILAAAEMAQTCLAVDRDDRTIDATLADIAAEAERCGRIVRSVLRFGREGASERRVQDLNSVVQRGVELIRAEATAAGVQLRLEPAPLLPSVAVDDTAIVQVVINLVQNALHEGSREVVVRTLAGPGTVQLMVSDDGRGIPEAELPRLCEPFYTTHRNGGGSGLGLSVTHGIVASHGGDLRIESRVGRGATFTIELPIAPSHTGASPAPS